MNFNLSIRHVILVGVLFGMLYLAFIGIRPLSHPDEGRYVRIPQEMLAVGDAVTPRLNGTPYFYKPPLFYWLQMLPLQLSGVSEWGLRFFPALAGLLTCIAVYLSASRLWGRETGLVSSVVLATSGLFFGMSQIVILDMVLTFFISAALLSYLCAIDDDNEGRRRLLFVLFYTALSGAILTKGLIGIAIPAVVIGIWTIGLRRWRDFGRIYLFPGCCLFALLVIPWHVLAHLANPATEAASGFFTQDPEGQGFLWFYFWHEHILRYLVEESADRGKPFWYFLMVTPLGLLPWALFLPPCLWFLIKGEGNWQKGEGQRLYLLLWALFPIVFFSLSSSKLIPYILPVFPAFALLVGKFLVDSRNTAHTWRWSLYVAAVGGILTCLILPWVLASRQSTPVSVIPYAMALIGVLGLAGCGVAILTRRGRLYTAVGVMVLGTMGFLALFNGMAAQLQRPSTRGFAEWIRAEIPPGTEVFTVFDYYQDFPVYLGQNLSVVENNPNEQQFGLMREPEQRVRFIPLADFGERLQAEEPAIILISTKHLDHHPEIYPGSATQILKQNEHFTLIGNAALVRNL